MNASTDARAPRLGRLAAMAISCIATAAALGACQNGARGTGSTAPVVANLEVESAPGPDSEAIRRLARQKARLGAQLSLQGAPAAVSARARLNKSSLFDRDFLYGADLQYSSIGDKSLSLVIQVEANAHLIARFRQVDRRLQLVASTRHTVESDVSAPERLIHEFPIVAQDADTVTIAFRGASPILSTVLSGDKAATPRQTWVRSASYDAAAGYMLFETSLEQADGTIAEFMETFFPRELLAKQDTKPLFADPELEPLAERFRFLGGDDVWTQAPGKGRVKTKVASRFDWKPDPSAQKVIDWYVTANAPDIYMPAIRDGVEGWNRYSRAMWGVDMVAFKGRLPETVKIGDPRYNVIGWDSVSQAGAAYESQAADPLTGIQSHSLIYLPLAWANIGKTFWQNGDLSEADVAPTRALKEILAAGRMLDRPLPVSCMREAMASISTQAKLNPEQFSRELLRGVLFHEMGHALGLAHNFKGSLSMDAAVANSPFSTSIMDYNQYQIEGAAFDNLDSASGPLLEYDRQILSALYAEGKDIKPSDPVLPACADAESDDRDGGVDPLCIRYDAGKDPTAELLSSIGLIGDVAAVRRGERSLPLALQSVATELPEASTIADEAKAKAALTAFATGATGLVNYYYASGAQSVSYMMRANVRSLLVFSGDLPAGYDEAGMRARAVQGLLFIANAEGFAPQVAQELTAMREQAIAWLATTPYGAAVPEAERAAKFGPLTQALGELPAKLAKATLSRVRASVWTELARQATAPYYLAPTAAIHPDFEALAIDVLEKGVSAPIAGETRPQAERLAAAKSLKTFADTPGGTAAIARARSRVTEEAGAARTAIARENARATLKALL